MLVGLFVVQTVLLPLWIIIFRTSNDTPLLCIGSYCDSTISRKSYKSVDTFVAEPDSRAQVMQLEENVKDFGLTYFGLSDKRQGLN